MDDQKNALMIPIKRHPLMEGMNDKNYVREFQKEAEIDAKLGLKNQSEISIKKVIEKDIDELTNSRDYYEVNKKILEKLFDLNKLKNKCVSYNAGEAIKSTFKCAKPQFYILFSSLGLATLGFLTLNIPVVVVFSFLCALVLLIAFVTTIGEVEFEYTFIDVRLDIEPVKTTNIKIPYGAKLKLLEAKESGIFEDFAIISPKFEENTVYKNIHVPNFNIDPAIVGLTADKRMFMVVYWDIEKDKEKVINDIKRFKKFKV
ncbi:MAG: hypothetical protein ACOC1K_02540 [Nanoarchaeota archaeon]